MSAPSGRYSSALLVGGHDVGRLHPGHVFLLAGAELAEFHEGRARRRREASTTPTDRPGRRRRRRGRRAARRARRSCPMPACGLGLRGGSATARRPRPGSRRRRESPRAPARASPGVSSTGVAWVDQNKGSASAGGAPPEARAERRAPGDVSVSSSSSLVVVRCRQSRGAGPWLPAQTSAASPAAVSGGSSGAGDAGTSIAASVAAPSRTAASKVVSPGGTCAAGRDVVEADHRQVARHRSPARARLSMHGQRKPVEQAEDGGRPVGAGEQPADRRGPARRGRSAASLAISSRTVGSPAAAIAAASPSVAVAAEGHRLGDGDQRRSGGDRGREAARRPRRRQPPRRCRPSLGKARRSRPAVADEGKAGVQQESRSGRPPRWCGPAPGRRRGEPRRCCGSPRFGLPIGHRRQEKIDAVAGKPGAEAGDKVAKEAVLAAVAADRQHQPDKARPAGRPAPCAARFGT